MTGQVAAKRGDHAGDLVPYRVLGDTNRARNLHALASDMQSFSNWARSMSVIYRPSQCCDRPPSVVQAFITSPARFLVQPSNLDDESA